ncbi:uncharacterized protein KY384_002082 [Bacidia gigantensis]|uniref:uncharacterized protein n=1 Tax=Bacidia gigantensis TaxID=2732470 RepID=UPI001D04965B|nr:uncharacterized protein KY384_002082 [Bacidia gigantensis]KAG8533299.1 hypothetical protein KY384_002082 [Bacidia gigantensis]
MVDVAFSENSKKKSTSDHSRMARETECRVEVPPAKPAKLPLEENFLHFQVQDLAGACTRRSSAIVCLRIEIGTMVNKPGKPKSKRVPVRLRHKIEKAGAAKQRKQKKLAKKDPQWRSRLKKDPGIPNLFPYKEKILKEIEEKRRLKEEEFARKREQSRKLREASEREETHDKPGEQKEDDALSDLVDDQSTSEEDGDNANPMSALLASARTRATEYEENLSNENEDEEMGDDDNSENGINLTNNEALHKKGANTVGFSNATFSKIYRTVVESSDIILYVLDARDPLGTRSIDVEREIVSADDGSKRLILILNKIDLVPPPVLRGWLDHLRRYFPTLPLRASLPASNAKTFDHKALTVKATSETLLRALKSYAHSQQLKRSIRVGIVGYPNVGKSSVINAMTSRRDSARSSGPACPVGAEAGVTTALREVKLDNKLGLLDSPGIVFNATSSSNSRPPHLTAKQAEQAHRVLLSALPPSAIDDSIPAVALLLHRLSHSPVTLGPLLDYYGIAESTLVPQNGDITTDLLVQIARKRGRLGKGGVPNLNAAGMSLLADWRDGRIRGWKEPPTDADREVAAPIASSNGVGDKQVVQEWSKEFQLDDLWGEDEADIADEAMEQ